MRGHVFTLALCLAVTPSLTSAADEENTPLAEDLSPPVHVLADDAPILVDGYPAPWVGDFDSDGRQDLLVGQYALGRMRIYRNVGSNARPEFGNFEWFMAGDQPACVPLCCQVAFSPQLVDFDADGRTDVLTGSGVGGEVFLFRRQADNTFAPAEVLENKSGEVLMALLGLEGKSVRAYNVTAHAYDWDQDGDLDLILGRAPLSLVLNTGSAQAPSYEQAQLIECGGKPLTQGLASVQMADWDADGLDDLISAANLAIVWYRNVGERGSPRFASPQLLVPARTQTPDTAVPSDYPGIFHAFCVADFNADGHLDLLLGDRFWRESAEAASARRPQSDEDKQRFTALQEQYDQLRSAAHHLTSRADRIAHYRNRLRVWQEMEVLRMATYAAPGGSTSQRGFVWYFERKKRG